MEHIDGKSVIYHMGVERFTCIQFSSCEDASPSSASLHRPFSGGGGGDRDPQTGGDRASAKAEETVLRHCHQELGLLPRLQPRRVTCSGLP